RPLVDGRVDCREFLARCHQECTGGSGVPDVLVCEDRLEAVPTLAEEYRVLAARLAPGDEVVARVGRRGGIPAVGIDGGGKGRKACTAGDHGGYARDEPTPRDGTCAATGQAEPETRRACAINDGLGVGHERHFEILLFSRKMTLESLHGT